MHSHPAPVENELVLPDGRKLHYYDRSGRHDEGGRGTEMSALPVFWHHGTPNLGAPPAPLFEAADRIGVRWVSYDRPAYGGSSPHLGRDMASAAMDVAAIADALNLERFAVMGHSGGGPHALACAALLPGRVVAAVSVAGLAPLAHDGFDWFAGMAAAGKAELRASVEGRTALEKLLITSDFDPAQFTASDLAMLEGDWAWLNTVAGGAMAQGIDGMVEDDLAIVAPWGFAPSDLRVPVLLLHGDSDRIVPSTHAVELARQISGAVLRIQEGDGHISILSGAVAALEWLAAHR